MVGPKKESTMWPRILFEEQKEALKLTLEERENKHRCTGNCGHFIEEPAEFSINSYYQWFLTQGRIDRLPIVLPISELDTEGWTDANVRQALLNLDLTLLDTYNFSM